MKMRFACQVAWYSFLLILTATGTVRGQGAMTVTGHVSAGTMPVRGATVRVETLNVGGTTDANGRYGFIIPSGRIRGQTVSLVASHPRYRSRSIELVLVGGSVERDFDMAAGDTAGSVRPPVVGTTRSPDLNPAVPATSVPFPAAVVASTLTRWGSSTPAVDSMAFADLAGPVDVGAALAGRFAALDVRTSSALGGTTSMIVRGPRSIAGLTQPLVVVNGIVVENTNISNATQLSGHGGFDYGTGLNDLNPEDVASVELLTGPFAAMQYGGRAANGVLLVTTKSARGLHGLEFSANQAYSRASVLRLPDYQNAYGQGLGGKFAFFDGKGGGVNDSTDQSWGPALDGSVVLQASRGEAARNDARGWFRAPTNVADYFSTAGTLATNAAIHAGGDRGQLRFSLDNRSSNGVTPGAYVLRRNALFTASANATSRLSVSGDLQFYSDGGHTRPGSGFDESNAVAGFAHMPRQVDVALYRVLLRDAAGNQLSWNYSGRNNPFWSSEVNTNDDSRSRRVVGGSATYTLTDYLSATVRGGSDHMSGNRNFTVASGWMGGFPYFAGRGSFASGGNQADEITSTMNEVEGFLQLAPRPTPDLQTSFTVGVGRHADNLSTIVRGTDNALDTAAVPVVTWDGSSNVNVLFAQAHARFHDRASVGLSARSESSSLLSGSSVSTLYPALTADFDLVRPASGADSRGIVESITLQGGWSRSGNSGSSALLQRLGFTAASSLDVTDAVTAPETTSGIEAGVRIRGRGGRAALDVTYYSDRTENLILPAGTSFDRSASVTNTGIEATAQVTPLARANVNWSVSATFGKNTNMVESVSGADIAYDLGARYGSASVEARSGNSLGVIVGTSFLRNPAGDLILRNGVPLPDSIAGRHILGETSPRWIGGVGSTLRVGWLELSGLIDARHGGQVFSASNMVGAYSGVLSETAFRPDTGLLIVGVDAATGTANTTHATTEDYYHALGPITERWIYDASFVKLREARLSATLPLQFVSALRVQSVRASIVGRNLAVWTNAPNIDPETLLGTSNFRGMEMGQLPTTKSIGVQLSLTP